MHKSTTVQKNINLENKLENCVGKKLLWLFPMENWHISVNWLALFRRPRKRLSQSNNKKSFPILKISMFQEDTS